jgi:hypothetical protein
MCLAAAVGNHAVVAQSGTCGNPGQPACLARGIEFVGSGVFLPYMNPHYTNQDEARGIFSHLKSPSKRPIELGTYVDKTTHGRNWHIPEHAKASTMASSCSSFVFEKAIRSHEESADYLMQEQTMKESKSNWRGTKTEWSSHSQKNQFYGRMTESYNAEVVLAYQQCAVSHYELDLSGGGDPTDPNPPPTPAPDNSDCLFAW